MKSRQSKQVLQVTANLFRTSILKLLKISRPRAVEEINKVYNLERMLAKASNAVFKYQNTLCQFLL